jgi:hypothetical protein
MRRSVLPMMAILAGIALVIPIRASAQVVYFGASPTFPIGDYSDHAKTGYIGVAGVTFPIGTEGLAVAGEGFFGQNSHSDVDGYKTYPYGGMAGLLYDFTPEAAGGVYVFGEAGLMVHKYSSDGYEGESDTGFAFGGGAGYGFPMGDTEIFVEGRYMQGNSDGGNTAFFGIVGGVALYLGGGD